MRAWGSYAAAHAKGEGLAQDTWRKREELFWEHWTPCPQCVLSRVPDEDFSHPGAQTSEVKGDPASLFLSVIVALFPILSNPPSPAQCFTSSAQASENDASSWISASSMLLMSLVFPVPNQEGGASADAKMSRAE